MSQVNDVTGDSLCSRAGTKSEREAFEDGWTRIFAKAKLETQPIEMTEVTEVTFGEAPVPQASPVNQP